MDKIYVFIYRNKSDGRIIEINIITEEQFVKSYAAYESIIENDVTKEMILAEVEQYNADSLPKTTVEWADCQTLLDAENLLHKIRTHEDTAFKESPKQQTTVEKGEAQ